MKSLFLVFLFVTTCFAQGPILPEVKRAIVFIYPINAEGQPVKIRNGELIRLQPGEAHEPIATGFFVGIKISDKTDRLALYVLTNKHVITLKNEPRTYLPALLIRANTKEGVDSFRINLKMENPDKTVYLHTDELVDAAVLVTPKGIDYEKKFEMNVIPEAAFTSKEDIKRLEISEGTDVFFAGLFTKHPGQKYNYPIFRFGKLALLSDEKVNWNGSLMDLYLVEVTSFGGNSGSPVFFHQGVTRRFEAANLGPPVLKLAGIMQGRFNELGAIGLLENNQTTQPQIPVAVLNSGIAAVVPAYKLLEIINSPELREQRRQIQF